MPDPGPICPAIGGWKLRYEAFATAAGSFGPIPLTRNQGRVDFRCVRHAHAPGGVAYRARRGRPDNVATEGHRIAGPTPAREAEATAPSHRTGVLIEERPPQLPHEDRSATPTSYTLFSEARNSRRRLFVCGGPLGESGRLSETVLDSPGHD